MPWLSQRVCAVGSDRRSGRIAIESGSSGPAVAGVIGAYLLLHPRVLVWVLAFRIIPLHIKAAWVLGIWVATQVIMVLISPVDQVAWWAHIGGLLAGALLVIFLRRPGVPLFDRNLRPV